MIVKNTYGVSVAFSTAKFGIEPKSEFTGSALQRKKQDKETVKKSNVKKKESKDKERKERSLSRRSKQKIRKKNNLLFKNSKKIKFCYAYFSK